MKMDWRAKALLLGGVTGALFGLSAAYLYIRTAEKHGTGVPPIEAGQAARVGLALLTVLRQIAALPAGKSEA